uniref:Ubiquitin-like domain-containing protein n=1 Tax=Panagrolaimus superbus TaxID=310955 RepID=A0A914Y4E7_9BILA
MQIFINALDGAVLKFNVESDTSVGEIKKSLGVEESIISFGSKILDSDVATLESYEIPDDATLNVNVRLLGGKVHGSLARAGKVRAQTPKVEKQEKKKKKRGRAFRRIQYNRRFVNVAVSGPGRKRGPNSNQS